MLFFPIYLNKTLFSPPLFFLSFLFNLDTGSGFLVVVALTFDLIVSRLSRWAVAARGDGWEG